MRLNLCKYKECINVSVLVNECEEKKNLEVHIPGSW